MEKAFDNVMNVIKKHGLLGFAILWLTSVQFEVKDLKRELIDCLKSSNHQVSEIEPMSKRIPKLPEIIAVLPCKPIGKIKKS